ncbi:spore germination protein [Sporosalibacterium faouarense]|uniref:spore germination protein n=1 Tax=Sporosalibacterium faouarense TaxID=516123 RepID=UPI00141C8505|nr:spore germination protein [Sporosalibacterium faouarense]MTI48874.1 spore germination protein [Bacillota bacterium]
MIISTNINRNLEIIKKELVDCDDIVYRPIKVGQKQNFNMAFIYVDGLIDKELISEFGLEPLLLDARENKPNPQNIKDNLLELVEKGNIAVSEVKELKTIEEALENLLIGETLLLIDGYNKILMLSSRGWPMRGITEPQIETVVRGPRDGFNETVKVNATLVRRRIRDTKLKAKYIKIGTRSKTDVVVMYMEDIVNKKLIDEVMKRLKGITVDAIIGSGQIQHAIAGNSYSPFPEAQYTERPDVVAAALYEGRIGILVDNTPFSLIVPATITTLLQSAEDYYGSWYISSLVRIVRFFAIFLCLLFPALYIAMTSYHPGMLPTQLAIYVAATRDTVPFPAFIEAFIMEGTIELLRESGSRLAGPIGTTIGIVGGLVIGQAAVEAGIVSPLMVIIVAVTTIASFAIPNYGLASGFRVLRFGMMAFAAFSGLYGIMLGLLLLATHLVQLNSFGIPYLSPLTNIGNNLRDLKDTLIRFPLQTMKKRPYFTQTIDETRMPGARNQGKKGDNSKDKKK